MKIPKRLQEEGFRFVLLNGKIPIEKNWQEKNNYKYNDNKLLDHKGNYGILCGKNRLIVIDFDNPRIQEEITPKLPKTFTVKTGTGMLHKYYKTDQPENIKILDQDKNTLADIQGQRKQIVAPGSIHPDTKKPYEIIDDSPIAEISMAKIKAVFLKYSILKKEKAKPFSHYKENDPIIREIKNKIRISDLLRDMGIDTTKNPTNCPMHSSKKGKCLSFNDSMGLWKCFHCDEGGNLFTLLIKVNEWDFSTTKKYLMEKAGINKRQTWENRKRKQVSW